MQKGLESSYYKITSINERIIEIEPKKYDELIAHVLMNMVFNGYSPNESDVRLLNGMIIYANANRRGVLFLLLTLILQDSTTSLKFYDLKNGIRFGSAMQKILRILDKKETPYHIMRKVLLHFQ